MRPNLFTSFVIVAVLAQSRITGISQPGKLRTISITRVVRIPLSGMESGQNTTASSFPGLAVSRGGEDEIPVGPDSFDVYDDGSFLVTDPLLDRISLFNSEGQFKRSWQLGFAADSVKVLSNETFQVRDAKTAAFYVVDQRGGIHPAEARASDYSARITSPQAGVVARGAGSGDRNTQINVQLDRPGYTLLSLELIGADEDGSAYIALESTQGNTGAEGVSVNKNVRRYSRDGKLLSQTDDLPLDYYVTPVDELRVRKGVVYQLMTTPSEVRLNIWNLN